MFYQLTRLAILSSLLAFPGLSSAQNGEQKNANGVAPLKILLVAGGCCHDYQTQTKLLKRGIEQRINAVVTVVLNPSKSTDTTFEIYATDHWADGFDVVLHDECTASVTDQPYVTRILDAHKNGVPAVNLHCAMHSYRWGDFRQPVQVGADNSKWYEMLGIQSTGHGPQSPIAISFLDSDHPITRSLKNWTTVNEELYNNVRVYGSSILLANGKQSQKPRKKDLKRNPKAQPKESTAVVAWTNEYGPKRTRIFSTTLGHNNDTVSDARYLDLITRGLLWTTGHLDQDGKATTGYAFPQP